MKIRIRPLNGDTTKRHWEAYIPAIGPDGTRLKSIKRRFGPCSASQAHRDAERVQRTRMLRGDTTIGIALTVAAWIPKYLDHCRARQMKASGVHSKATNYRLHVIPLFGALRLDVITEEHTDQLIAALAAKSGARNRGRMSAKSINNVVTDFNQLLAVAARQRTLTGLTKAPTKAAPLPFQRPQMKAHDIGTLDALLAGAQTVSHQTYTYLKLGADTGGRKGELNALLVTDLNFLTPPDGAVQYSKSAWRDRTTGQRIVSATKGMQVRPVLLTPDLSAALYIQRRRQLAQGYTHLFTNEYKSPGQPLNDDTATDLSARAAKAAGLKEGAGVHILRHTFCSGGVAEGGDLEAIRAAAGHTDIRTTQGYIHGMAGAGAALIGLLATRKHQRAAHAALQARDVAADGPATASGIADGGKVAAGNPASSKLLIP